MHNSTKIRLKHGITTAEAEQPFSNNNIVKFDRVHSNIEKRYQLLGPSDKNRVLFVVFTIRDQRVRIISARVANKKERSQYGQI